MTLGRIRNNTVVIAGLLLLTAAVVLTGIPQMIFGGVAQGVGTAISMTVAAIVGIGAVHIAAIVFLVALAHTSGVAPWTEGPSDFIDTRFVVKIVGSLLGGFIIGWQAYPAVAGAI